MDKYKEVITAFESLSIVHALESHTAAFTVDEQADILKHLPGVLTKNLFFKDKKHGYFLVTAASTQTVDTKILAKKLNMGKMNLRFASEEVLTEKLGVEQGSVTPLCVMNDTAGEVTFVLDASLLQVDTINCHPLQNDKTVSISPDDLKKFCVHYKHDPLIIDFEAVVEAAEAPAKPVKGAKMQKKKKAVDETASSKNQDGVSASKEDNFSEWYTETITKSGLIDYYDVSGCYILRPDSYAIWEHIQEFLNKNIKAMGVRNCYFPMFVTPERLNKEKDHVEGFAAEVAWVTKSGETDLKEPLAVRPTSETIMYPSFKNWIRSHRDLPLKLNQWNNVVRWEFKSPTPFIRTREFLWQEGHTAHATKEEADVEVQQVLDFYAACYAELLAVPMIKGFKTAKEKFAGADYTTTIEGFIPSTGRGIQAATSHHLGQNFAKMFGIEAEGEKKEKIIPYQNSWGFTTRSIGVMIMVHGDDKGLVLPPRVAPIQVVIVPIRMKIKDEELGAESVRITDLLKEADIRVQLDDRRDRNPGWKYNHYELKGVPLRMELGPRDLEKCQVVVVRRDTGKKYEIAFADLSTAIPALLVTMQQEMLARAVAKRDSCIIRVTKWDEFVPVLQNKCMALTPFCNETEWEEEVKKKSKEESLLLNGLEDEEENTATSSGAKTLCIPYSENETPMPPGTACFISGKPATHWVLWGRSY